jgi:hypothetical protein
MGVLNQLRLRGSSRCEVEEQRVRGHRHGLGRERRVSAAGIGVTQPAVDGLADHDPRVHAWHVVELGRVRRWHDDVTGVPALHAVEQIGGAEQRRSGDDHRAELHGGQDRLPELDLVTEHDDHPVTAGDAVLPQPVRHLIRARAQLGKGAPGLAAFRLDDPQRRPITAVHRYRVEPVQRPVEFCKRGRAIVTVGRRIILAVVE